MAQINIMVVMVAFIFTYSSASIADSELILDHTAPVFSARSTMGALINLADLRGKTVILEWTNANCPFVIKHYQSGNLPRLQNSARLNNIAWLQVITAVSDPQETRIKPLNSELSGASSRMTIVDTDGRLSLLYGAQTTPHIFIVNAEGILVYKGGVDNIASPYQADIAIAENYISAALADLAEGKKVAKSNTLPYGCNVSTPARS